MYALYDFQENKEEIKEEIKGQANNTLFVYEVGSLATEGGNVVELSNF